MNKKIIFLILIILFSISYVSAKEFEVPKKVKIISQSCTESSVFVTVIDLSNNEVVILEYSTHKPMSGVGRLLNVIRTGMIVDDPNKQSLIIGKDAPFKDES